MCEVSATVAALFAAVALTMHEVLADMYAAYARYAANPALLRDCDRQCGVCRRCHEDTVGMRLFRAYGSAKLALQGHFTRAVRDAVASGDAREVAAAEAALASVRAHLEGLEAPAIAAGAAFAAAGHARG